MKSVYFMVLFFASIIFVSGCASSFKVPDAEKQPKTITEDESDKIKQAIKYFDKGDYDKAISIYEELLKTNPDNITALYEISYSLYKMKNYQRCLDYAVKGMEYESQYLSEFYAEAANSLDILGKAEEAISVYKKGIEKFPDDHMLHYNQAITYISIQKPEEAEESLINSIKTNKFYPSSHLALADLYMKQGRQIPSLLLLCRFLTLEPNSARSRQAASMLDELMNWGVEREGDKNVNISIFDAGNNDSPYTVLEMFLKLKRASGIMDAGKGKSKAAARVDEISSLISMINKKNEKNSDFTAGYLFPYFMEMNKSKNTEAFVYFIHQSAGNKEVNDWLDNHKNNVEEFLSWNESYKWNN